MAIQEWSEDITVVELTDDPQFTDELNSLADRLDNKPTHVVLNFGAVSFINSSNIARVLRIRKEMLSIQRKLILCGVNSQVWGVVVVTGLDRIFDFTKDIATALATLQLSGGETGDSDS